MLRGVQKFCLGNSYTLRLRIDAAPRHAGAGHRAIAGIMPVLLRLAPPATATTVAPIWDYGAPGGTGRSDPLFVDGGSCLLG